MKKIVNIVEETVATKVRGLVDYPDVYWECRMTVMKKCIRINIRCWRTRKEKRHVREKQKGRLSIEPTVSGDDRSGFIEVWTRTNCNKTFKGIT